jgi:hypothetical protein
MSVETIMANACVLIDNNTQNTHLINPLTTEGLCLKFKLASAAQHVLTLRNIPGPFELARCRSSTYYMTHL